MPVTGYFCPYGVVLPTVPGRCAPGGVCVCVCILRVPGGTRDRTGPRGGWGRGGGAASSLGGAAMAVPRAGGQRSGAGKPHVLRDGKGLASPPEQITRDNRVSSGSWFHPGSNLSPRPPPRHSAVAVSSSNLWRFGDAVSLASPQVCCSPRATRWRTPRQPGAVSLPTGWGVGGGGKANTIPGWGVCVCVCFFGATALPTCGKNAGADKPSSPHARIPSPGVGGGGS